MKDRTVTAMNSPEYWDQRFKSDWDERGGPDQTAFFAKLGLSLLPPWLAEDIRQNGLSVLDFGCAEGEALPTLCEAFPQSKVSGGDVSHIAIERARERFPQLEFTVLAATNPTDRADVVFCSNTIEHFSDWRGKLDEIAACARQHLIILAPFREPEPLFAEHMAQFDFDVFPAVLPGDLKLQHVSVRTSTDLPGSRWVGQQFLAIWSKQTAVFAQSGEGLGDLDDLDLRGVDAAAIPLCLGLAKGGYTKLALERADKARLTTEVASARADLETQRITMGNELITTRVGLENKLIETRVRLENELYLLESRLADGATSPNEGVSKPHGDSANEGFEFGIRPFQTRMGPHAAGSDLQSATSLAPDLQKASDQYNARVAMKERALQATFDTMRQNYSRVVSMRSFQLMMKGLQRYAKLRSRTISLPTSPERVTITLERFDPGQINPTAAQAAAKFTKTSTAVKGLERAKLKASPDLPPTAPVRSADANPVLMQIDLTSLPQHQRDGVEEEFCGLVLAALSMGVPAVVFVIGPSEAITERISSAGGQLETFDGWTASAYTAALAKHTFRAAFLHEGLSGAAYLTEHNIPITEVVHRMRPDADAQAPDASAALLDGVIVQRRIAVSDQAADCYAKVRGVPRSSVEVIPVPLDSSALIRPERRLLERSRSKWRHEFVITRLGAFVDAKAESLLVKAFDEVRKTSPHARLRLIGAVTDQAVFDATCSEIESSGLSKLVEIYGPLNERALSGLLASSHVLVQPSSGGGASRSQLYAAYFGLPLVDCSPTATVASEPQSSAVYPVVAAADMGLVTVRQLAQGLSAIVTDYAVWSERGYAGQRHAGAETLEDACARLLGLRAP
jgi:SAM-dependent methyltransferase